MADKQSKLEIAAIEARKKNIVKNIYDDASTNNQYSGKHTRALADQETPNQGKGTGNYLDIENYKAGSDLDINGNQPNAVGSGRNPAMALNGSQWGFGPVGLGMQNYSAPDTSKNTGQVTI